MNNKKKILSFALACLMIVMTFSAAIPAFADESTAITAPRKEGNWASYTVAEPDKAWYGDGSATAFEIDSLDEFIYFVQLSCGSEGVTFAGKTIAITCDLDLGDYYYTGISTDKKDFQGTIVGKKGGVEGASITVSNMFIKDGTGRNGFVTTQKGGGLKNLVFDNCIVTTYASNVAVVCGLAHNATAEFSNITVKNSKIDGGNESQNDDKPVGIIIGQVEGTCNVTVNDCNVSNSEIAWSGKDVGTVVGKINNGSVAIKNVTVDKVDLRGVHNVGGVVGWFVKVGLSIDNISVTNVNLYGAFDGSAKFSAVIGTCNKSFTLSNAYLNNISVNTEKRIDYYGNIVGYVDGGGSAVDILAIGCITSDSSADYNIKEGEIVSFYKINAPIMQDGASMRTTEGSNGLRFTSTLDAASINAAASAKNAGLIKDSSYGTVICRNDKLNGEFTAENLNSSDYTDIKAKDGIYQIKDAEENVTGVRFNAALTGIAQNQKSIKFAARSYFEIKLADDTIVRAYSAFDETKNVRSMEYVANMALADVTDAVDTEVPFPHAYEIGYKNSNTDGTAYVETTGTFYSRYSAVQCSILKTWATAN